ncbi:uncharacterized protein IUM83_02592 [Phytophthora cinnamomi]|uniref:uncharacterized protein n=1 Tax=Phytophthora cinnamomi TaxID=4785 RepID=UPI0035595B9C|nr:hypothetical protein IUM83_02592 [Phytophthora cinnamomi]
MVRLPSARYHSEMAGITKENAYGTIFPLFVFGLLQILSFAVLTAIIKRNCGTQALRQLAFVLETQMPLIQDKLLFWPTMTFCFRVVHFGVDFTFKFAQH